MWIPFVIYMEDTYSVMRQHFYKNKKNAESFVQIILETEVKDLNKRSADRIETTCTLVWLC